MKVLHILHEPDLVEFQLIKALTQAGIEPTVVIRANGRFKSELIQLGVKVHEFTFASRLSLGGILFLRKLIKNSDFKLIHSFSARALSNALIATIGNPITQITYRGTSGHLNRFDPSSWLSYLSPRVAKIICVSNSVKDYLSSVGVPPERLITIYKGHDLTWYQGQQTIELSQFDIRPERFTIVCVANMRPVKGVDLLIKAFSLLPPESATELLLVGSVRDRAIARAIESSPRKANIKLVGPQSNVTALLKKCDLFVMPSRKREGFPKAVLEAMCCRLPVIVTAVGGMAEIVRAGIDGLVVPPEDPKALAQAISQIRTDDTLRKKLGTNALDRVTQSFNFEQTVVRTLELYRSF